MCDILNIWEHQRTQLWIKSRAVLQTVFQMECVKTLPTWRPHHPSISNPCTLIYRNIPTNIHTLNGKAACTDIFILNALSELFMAWQVCCVLSNAEYLLLPTIPTTMEPKKLIREEKVHAQLSETVSGLNWIVFCDRYQNPINFTRAWPLQLSQTLSGTQLVMHVWCYACRINTQHYDAQSRYLYSQRMLMDCLYSRHRPSHHERQAIHCHTSANLLCDCKEFVLATWTIYSAFLLSLS